ncbi:hypothetical protein AGABI2DRAFT_194294, partial [Agaricus bisporus var. bisporus H97]|uniref:hypothetical protein n=1 Tax=Agaricus bisporus var. bisporus (strain H97 / ATCC MYA-4626 / FGSC 10389) TaxID=936046 RepID=UPI00029F58D1
SRLLGSGDWGTGVGGPSLLQLRLRVEESSGLITGDDISAGGIFIANRLRGSGSTRRISPLSGCLSSNSQVSQDSSDSSSNSLFFFPFFSFSFSLVLLRNNLLDEDLILSGFGVASVNVECPKGSRKTVDDVSDVVLR